MNLGININQKSSGLQPAQQNLKPEQRVYLYGDTEYTGTLIRPLERTYPPRWTVELDRGGYDSATIKDITPLDIQPDPDIPFSNFSQVKTEIIALKKQLQELERENQIIRQQYGELEEENKRLNEELTEAKDTIRRAKDISPVMRLSLKRVKRLANHACMDVQRTVGGWILKMGTSARKFRRLADIWDLISQDNWYLSDVLPPDKLIPINQIKPAPRRKRPNPWKRQPELPYPITSKDMLRQRELASFRY